MTSKKSRASQYGQPSPKRKQSIRSYAKEHNISFYEARYIVSGLRYSQTSEQRSYWQRGYNGRIEGMLKRYRDIYGETDTRFNGNITTEKLKEFRKEVIDRYELLVINSSRTKKFSSEEELKFKRTADMLRISEYRQREIYPTR